MRPRISIWGLVRPLVGRSIRLSVHRSVTLLSNLMKNGLLRILNDLDSAGRGRKGDREEGGTRRKEEQGGKRDKRNKGREEWKNEKVAKKWKMKKSLKDASLASLGLVSIPFLIFLLFFSFLFPFVLSRFPLLFLRFFFSFSPRPTPTPTFPSLPTPPYSISPRCLASLRVYWDRRWGTRQPV